MVRRISAMCTQGASCSGGRPEKRASSPPLYEQTTTASLSDAAREDMKTSNVPRHQRNRRSVDAAWKRFCHENGGAGRFAEGAAARRLAYLSELEEWKKKHHESGVCPPWDL